MNAPNLAVVRSAAPLSASEARALTDRIRSTAEDLASLLHEAYERRAWAALGYDSWRAYAMEELSISQSRAYQLLDKARVVAAIKEAAGTPISNMLEITTREVAAVKPNLAEVTEQIRERVESGEDPAEAIAEVVADTRTDSLGREQPARKPEREPETDGEELHDFQEMLSLGAEPGSEEEIGADVAAAAAEADGEDAGEWGAEPEMDTAAELVHALEECARLQAEVNALSADDRGRELVQWMEKYARLEGRVQQMLRTEGELKKQLRYQTGLLKKLREVVGVEQNRELLPRLVEVLG